MIQIKNKHTGEVICEGETIAAAVSASLASLGGADLRGANLSGANLRGANLRGAYLGGAYLGDADLGDADLGGAYLGDADLGDADLGGADLRGANLRGANLSGANLRGAKLAFQSHDLLAEILRRAAGDDIAKLKAAGLILISRDKCWREFLVMAAHEPLADWALDELARWVQPGDGAPEVLRQRAAANEAVLEVGNG